MTSVHWFDRVVTGLVTLLAAIVVGLAAPVALAQSTGASPTPAVMSSSGSHYAYDYRPDFARPPPLLGGSLAFDSSSNILDPVTDGGRVQRAFSGPEVQPSAPSGLAAQLR